METGSVQLLSRENGPAGAPARDRCRDASISANGRYVAFTCDGALDPADDNDFFDVYRRDLETGELLLISRNPQTGAPGNDDSSSPSVAENGSVAFASRATNLVAGLTMSRRQVFLRLPVGENLLISKNQVNGNPGNASSQDPSISALGNRVAFESTASNLVVGDTNGVDDIFVSDFGTGETFLVSRADGNGPVGTQPSRSPVISGNGTVVAFASESRFDPATDPDDDSDVYVRSLTSGSTSLVSVLANGETGNRRAFSPSISRGGAHVAFLSDSDNLHPDDRGPAVDAFVKDLDANSLGLVSRLDGTGTISFDSETTSVAVDATGKNFAMAVRDDHQIFDGPFEGPTVLHRSEAVTPNRTRVAARPPGTDPFVNRGGYVRGGMLSGDGRQVVFDTNAPEFGGTFRRTVVVMRDTETGSFRVVSALPDGEPLPGISTMPAISGDGRVVAFVNLPPETPANPTPVARVVVNNVTTGKVHVVTRSTAGEPANGSSLQPMLDQDGSRVAFLTEATNLDPADPAPDYDAYVHDIPQGTTTLASRADGPSGVAADDFVLDLQISADGSKVAFSTTSPNLDPADTDTSSDVFIRDLDQQTTRLVSTGGDGGGFISNVFMGGLSSDGSKALLVGDLDGQGSFEAGVKDLADGSIEFANLVEDGQGVPAPRPVFTAKLSRDGKAVAFTTEEADPQVFLRRLDRGQTTLVSRADGVEGEPAVSPSGLDLSTNGSCVSFLASGIAGASVIYPQVFMRSLERDCGRKNPDAADTTAPVVSRLRAKPKSFRVRGRGRKGTRLFFRITEAARVTVRVGRVVPGRRTARGCVVATGKVPKKRRCKAIRPVLKLARNVSAGPVRLRIPAKRFPRRTRSGRHRINVLAADRAGNRSKPVSIRVRVRRGAS